MAEEALLPEIIAEILSRLPVKSLCRFKSVSKPWNSLINSPNFIKLHISKTLISENNHKNPNLIFCSVSFSTAAIAAHFRFTELHHPLLNFPDCDIVKILGSCNGVVCISPASRAYACLYNPTIGTHHLLPPTPSRFPEPNRKPMPRNPYPKPEEHILIYGFGYDSVSDDYKLLRILEYSKNSVFVGSEICLYSLKNNSWKFVVDDKYVNSAGLQFCNGTLFNESLHFVQHDSETRPFIRCFNLRTETFSVMELPKVDENYYKFCFVMRQVGEYLSFFLLNYHDLDISGWHYRLVNADFWILKEATWVRLFSISDMSSIGVRMSIKPLVYSEDGQKILLELDDREFGWYDWEKKHLVRVLIRGLPRDKAPSDTFTYVESLVSFGKLNCNSKGKTTVSKKRKKNNVDRFLSSGFKLKL
ncbi:F-box protein CPR1-like [Silene latifolia]|uniref:F-box protein CPR1-like n=1 Tax=Silene latifolia TaxID=37657 RepID=UPI003D787637